MENFNGFDLGEMIADDKTLIVCNHSGGKDSQAMYLFLSKLVPKERLVVIHASLGNIEWPGTIEHIEDTIEDEALYIVKAKKTFFEMVRSRGFWPAPKYRQCTSDLKRDPIVKKIRQLCNDFGYTTVINCSGIRAAESSNRAKAKPWKKSKRYSTKTRDWYEWLPIFEWPTDMVFQYIEEQGQKPHWAYGEGMTRLSCSFCIMSSQKDLETAARLRPDLLREYVDLEKEIGQTFRMPSKVLIAKGNFGWPRHERITGRYGSVGVWNEGDIFRTDEAFKLFGREGILSVRITAVMPSKHIGDFTQPTDRTTYVGEELVLGEGSFFVDQFEDVPLVGVYPAGDPDTLLNVEALYKACDQEVEIYFTPKIYLDEIVNDK